MSNNYDRESSATIKKWQKIRENDEASHESAKAGLYKFFETALKNDAVRRQVEKELQETRHSGGRSKFRGDESGFNIVDDDYDETVDGSGKY